MSEKDKFKVVKNNNNKNSPAFDAVKNAHLANKKNVEDIISVFMADKSPSNMQKLMGVLSKAIIIVPAQLIDSPDKSGRKVPAPIMIKMQKKAEALQEGESSEQETFIPVFSSEERLPRNKETGKLVFPGQMLMPFDETIKIMEAQKAKGIIINNGSDNLMLHPKFFETYKQFKSGNVNQTMAVTPQGAPSGTKAVKMSGPQMHALFRRTTECRNIPAELFKAPAAFMTQLDNERESFIYNLYKKIYPDNVPCPYDEENFSVMILNISADTVVASIELPANNLSVKSALAMYLIWNPQNDDVHYYLIEKGEQGENDVLCSVNAQMQHEELMTAPAEGSEISAILELMREEAEEE